MNNSKRIQVNLDDTTEKYVKFKLEQNINSYEILSLNISQKDIYQAFNANFGVLIGRVIANDGIGIPNAKVSIFIPIEENDEENEDILSVYPYKTPRDENNDGKRYNLLPRVGRPDADGIVSPKQPFGSFPTKEEILTNDDFLDVYKKYYKYTTITNDSGDYMLYGVPIGVQTAHMSVDITDIGKYSMTPASMITNLGYSENLFYEDGITIKPSNDLEDLPHIGTQEISVDVVPFWGDSDNFDIGVTRQDFRIKAQLINTFTIFGTTFSDGDNSMWTENFHGSSEKFREYYRIRDDAGKNISINSKRIGKLTETVYYYPNKFSDTDIDNGTVTPDQMLILDPSEYTKYIVNGDFVFIINSNRNKYITDGYGNEINVPDSYKGGVYRNFRGFITFEVLKDDLGYGFVRQFIGQSGGDKYRAYPFRYKFKFPQKSPEAKSFNDQEGTNTLNWREETYNFEASKIYSIAKFYGTVFNNSEDNDFNFKSDGSRFGTKDVLNKINTDPFWNVGVISTDEGFDEDNDIHEFPSNSVTNAGALAFGANWMNFCLHFPQIGWLDEDDGWDNFGGIASNTHFTAKNNSYHFYEDNEQLIGGTNVNTKWFARSDLHHTDFIEIDKDVVLDMYNETTTKGFKASDVGSSLRNKIENGDFRNGEYTCPYDGGKIDGVPTNGTDTDYYFYKGYNDSDVIALVVSLGLI